MALGTGFVSLISDHSVQWLCSSTQTVIHDQILTVVTAFLFFTVRKLDLKINTELLEGRKPSHKTNYFKVDKILDLNHGT